MFSELPNVPNNNFQNPFSVYNKQTKQKKKGYFKRVCFIQ